MISLIAYEAKKLFVKKFHYVILVLLILLPCFELWAGMATLELHNKPMMYGEQTYDKGAFYSGFQALDVMDQRLHSVAGEITQEQSQFWWDQANKEEEELRKEPMFDEQMLVLQFGNNWKAAYEKSLRGELTTGELNDLRKEAGSFTSEVNDSPAVRARITTFPKLYTREFDVMLNSVNDGYPKIFDTYFTTPSAYYVTAEKKEAIAKTKKEHILVLQGVLDQSQREEIDPALLQVYGDVGDTEEVYAYFNQKFSQKPTAYDSSIATELFINIMNQKSMFMVVKVILLGVLLLSVFHQEYTYKTDQIMKAMKVSLRKQATAKLLFIAIFCMSSMVFDLLVYLIGIQLLVGFHNLQVVFQDHKLVSTTIDSPIVTYQDILVQSSVLYLLVGTWIVGWIALCSSLIKRTYTALLVYVFVFVVLAGVPFLYQKIYAHTLPAAVFFPTTLFRPDTLFTHLLINPYVGDAIGTYNWNYLTLFGNVIPTSSLLVVLIPLISLSLYCIASSYYRKREIQNA